jgi:26S proteasome non-ATPase regulatory subunit 10
MSRPLLDTQYELDGDPTDNRDALEGPPARRRWGSRFLAFLLAAAAVYGAYRGFTRHGITSEELGELTAMASAPLPKMPTKDDLGGVEPQAVITAWQQHNAQRLAADKIHLWSAYALMLLCPVGLGCSVVVWWRGQFKRPQGAAVMDPVQLSVAMTSVVLLAAVRGFDAYTLMSLGKMPPCVDLRTAFHEVREAKKPERYAILKEKLDGYFATVNDKAAKPAARLDAARRLHAIVSRKEFGDICPDGERGRIVRTLTAMVRANYADDAVCTLLVRSVGAAGAMSEMADLSAEREKTKATWVDVKSEAALRCLFAAVTAGDEASVKTLIQRGVALNALVPGEGRTALHEAVARRNAKVTRALLDGRARTDVPGKYGVPRAIREYPLHRAVATGDAQLVKLLLAFGANPNVADDGGMTPLHRAASTGDADCAAALVAKGAKVNTMDKGGRTPYDVAMQVCPREKMPPVRDLLERNGGLAATRLPLPGRQAPVAATPQE